MSAWPMATTARVPAARVQVPAAHGVQEGQARAVLERPAALLHGKQMAVARHGTRAAARAAARWFQVGSRPAAAWREPGGAS
mmetsp:Transcript_116284/g.335899  ORF Transcript_116284/g.335899 Transcript_116284/m.335899 type:complete len:82 (+) Transcript_116284:103-348(+)